MNAIKKARRVMEDNPQNPDAKLLARLVLSLETEGSFELRDLYQLIALDAFDLAMDILKEWRIDRYYAGKAKLFDVSYQVQAMGQQ